MSARWRLCSPQGVPAGVGILQIAADDADQLDRVLEHLGLGMVDVGQVRLRDLLGVDQGVVMRVSPTCCILTPHGGVEILRRLGEVLRDAGLEAWEEIDPLALYPEASSEIEARMLLALASCASPRGVDLLLVQPERWSQPDARTDPDLDRVRMHLLVPPTVVLVGPPNVGKSTLLNAMGGRMVSITRDEEGTTRDHVGVMLELDGLCVRCVDTPGLRNNPDSAEAEAWRLAEIEVARADLVLLCGDSGSPPPAPEHLPVMGGRRLTVALRRDLGAPAWEADLAVSTRTGEGIDALARLIRRTLVSDRAIEDPSPWRFW